MPPDPNPTPSEVVQLGSHVQVELLSEAGREQLEFDIVPDQVADFSRGLLGEGTPLARAILGRPAGETQPYPQGDIQAVKIVSIAAGISLPDAQEYARRQEARRKAVEEAQRRDAMIFASSYSGKWGDYDPEGIEAWNKENKDESQEDSEP